MTAPRIVCLGDLMIDVVTRLAEPLHLGSDTPADVRWSGGGSAANTAAWLAADGARAAFIGRVGHDIPGRVAVDALLASGVQVHVAVDPDQPTGTCVVLVDTTGERTMVPSAGANAALTTSDVDAAGLKPGDHLHVSGYALFGAARVAAEHAIHTAHRLGMSVSIGAASSAPLRAIGREAFLSWAHRTTVFANRDEAAELTGTSDPADAARELARRTGHAVVTGGAGHAVWSDGAHVVSAVPDYVDVVDSTGAGDAFAAGFLAATFGRAAPAAALAHGHALAARACRNLGARPVIA